MDIDQLVTDTFTAHEHLAPAPDEIWPEVRARTAARRMPAARPLAVAASVAVVGAATWAGVALSAQHGGRAAHSPAPAAARSSVPPPAPATSRAKATRPPTARAAALVMPFDLGWLPPGSVGYIARRIGMNGTIGSTSSTTDGEYMLTVTTATAALDIDVQQMRGPVSDAHFKSGPGAALTIGGHRAVESARAGGPGGYEVYFGSGAGGTMYVNVAAHQGSRASAATLRSVGRHVAAAVHFPGTAEVTPAFELGRLPDGLRRQTFDVEGGNATSYLVGHGTSDKGTVSVGTNIAVETTGRPGRPVQGHATRYLDDHGYRTLTVLHAVHGLPLGLSGRVPKAELYAIADTLMLPPS